MKGYFSMTLHIIPKWTIHDKILFPTSSKDFTNLRNLDFVSPSYKCVSKHLVRNEPSLCCVWAFLNDKHLKTLHNAIFTVRYMCINYIHGQNNMISSFPSCIHKSVTFGH